MYVAGIEGGATHSKLLMCNEAGVVIASIEGPGTNHWMLGIPECARRIAKMVEDAKKAAGIGKEVQLKALGLSLSGCEQVSFGFFFEIRKITILITLGSNKPRTGKRPSNVTSPRFRVLCRGERHRRQHPHRLESRRPRPNFWHRL